MNSLRNLLLAAAVAILPCATAQAGSLSLTFDTPSVTAFPGDSIVFSGTVTNLENVVVDLNSCGVNLPGFTNYNCDVFLDPILGAPFTLSAHGDPGDTAHFEMFTVTVDNPFVGAYGQPFTGVYTIFGALEDGTGGSDTNLAEATFNVTVAPEPGTAGLLCLALPLAVVVRRRFAG